MTDLEDRSNELFEDRGWHCVPLTDKGPRIKDWPQGEPKEGWDWSNAKDLGVITGRLSATTVIDIDSKKHPEAWAWAKEHLNLDTLIEKTTNGYHVFYQYDHRWQKSYIKVPIGIDICNDGQQVRYRGTIAHDAEPAELPAPWPGIIKEGRQLIVRAAKPQTFEEGERNAGLFAIAAAMVHRNEPRAQILQEIRKVNQEAPEPLQDREVVSIARSAERYRILPQDPEIESLANLAKIEWEDLDWIVGDFMATGLYILAGAPKARKSFLTLQLAAAVAAGKDFLGMDTVECDVTLFALEDGKRRIGMRAKDLPGGVPPVGIEVRFDIQGNPLETLKHIKSKLIIIDTGARCFQLSSYEDAHAILGPIQHWAIENDKCVLIIWHTVKAPLDSEGKVIDRGFDAIMGTRGLQAVADGMMLLANNKLATRGRDIEDGTIDLNSDGPWWVAASELTSIDRQILAAIPETHAVQTKDIVDKVDASKATVERHIKKLLESNSLTQPRYGFYAK